MTSRRQSHPSIYLRETASFPWSRPRRIERAHARGGHTGNRAVKRLEGAKRPVSVIATVFLTPLVCLAFSAPAHAAEGEPCPNEQLRSESNANPTTGQPYSAQLPDCRAYELVSPPNSEGYPVPSAGQPGGGPPKSIGSSGRLYQISSSGALFFSSQASPPATGAVPNGRAVGVFVSKRDTSGWATTDLTPFNIPDPDYFVAGSSDAASALIFTSATLSAADQDNPTNQREGYTGQDLYRVYGSTQNPELVSQGPLPRTLSSQGSSGIHTPVVNANLTAVGFTSSPMLVSGANPEATDCYVWTQVGSRQANLTNSDMGSTGNCVLFGVTPEGRPVYVDTSGDSTNGDIFVGVESLDAGVVPRVQISGPTPFAAAYDGTSPDGRVAYVTTTDHLDANGSTGTAVYAVEVPKFPPLELPAPPAESSVACISCEHSGAGAQFVGQSADGSHVFFSSSEGLWSYDVQTAEATELTAATDVSQAVSSENGDYLIGLTTQLAGNPHGTPDVYEFTAGRAPQLITSGDSDDSYATSAEPANGYPSLGGVANDGLRIVYDSQTLGEAAPSVIDEWVSGQTQQISPADAASSYQVMGTAGGELEDVFFEAHEPLVAQDENAGTTDIYDAQIDGGFPAPAKSVSTASTPNPLSTSPTPYGGNLATPTFGLPTLSPDTSRPATAPKALTRPQLAKALKYCHKDKSKSRRARCERSARKAYGPTTESKKAKK
jgi:hypothetical protein